MAGRHRTTRPSRSLKAPAAAGATIAALGLAGALTMSLTSEEPGAANLAAHSAASSSEPTSSSTTSAKPKPTTSKKKAAKKHKKAKATATVKAAPKTTTPPAQDCSTDLDGTQPHVAQVGNHVLTKFDVDSVGGRAGRGGASDHPSGLAIDFMVDTETGNALADYVLQNQSDFNVTYVIWRQRYNDGSGWSTMEDRGDPTANHYDHVHVSFAGGGDVDVTC
jgi:hypothetical protein